MKIIRRKSFTQFATLDSEKRCLYVKVIDTKRGHKVLVKNPEYCSKQDNKPWRTLNNY